jgi:sulfate adenylyltransferase
MAVSPAKTISEQEDQMFRLLRQLDTASGASQRAMATAIGLSLGRFNALLRSATDAGLVKISEHTGTASPINSSPERSRNTMRCMQS